MEVMGAGVETYSLLSGDQSHTSEYQLSSLPTESSAN